MDITSKIDALTLTKTAGLYIEYKCDTLADLGAAVVLEFEKVFGFPAAALAETRKQKFYDATFVERRTGAIMSIAFESRGTGIKFEMKGETLGKGAEGEFLLTSALRAGYRATRIDVAFDVFNGGYFPSDLHEEYVGWFGVEGKTKTNLYGGAQGQSFEIGSRQSDRFVRVYDKAREQGLDNDWVRFEVEMKGHLSRGLADAIAEDHRVAVSQLLIALQLQDNPVVMEIMAYAKSAGWATIKAPRVKSNREKWLRGDVTSALEKFMNEEPERACEVLLQWVAMYEELVLDGVAEKSLLAQR